jgi:hypothetical protein
MKTYIVKYSEHLSECGHEENTVKSQIYAFEGTATNKCKIEESVNLGK